MIPEFCIGISKNGVLYEGLAAKALYRECPEYDHPWYTEQADWIVTEIEVQARPITAKFHAAFHNPDIETLREGLSRLARVSTGSCCVGLVSHDDKTQLSIAVTANGDTIGYEVEATFTEWWKKRILRFENEDHCQPLSDIAGGLNKIGIAFPVLSTRETQSEGRAFPRSWSIQLLHFAQSLVRLPRRLAQKVASRPPMELYMEYEGQCVAKLTAPQFAEMFWTSFAFAPTTPDPRILQMLESRDWWETVELSKIRYRFVDDGHIAFGTFPAGGGVLDGRIALRTSGLVH